MKKLLFLFAVLLGTVGAWAQVYQKVPHTKWTVTAPNESRTKGNEGGVDFIKDENPLTFYHSDYSGNAPLGNNGLQGFLIDMGEVISDISKITYTGRSDDNTSGWAQTVKIYLYETLPDGLPADLSTLSHDEKETLFTNVEVLGDPAFDNTDNPWADNRNMKTAEFDGPMSARYVLFVKHSSNSNWLTCADFHVWQKVEGIVEDSPYFLKIDNAASEGEWYLDTRTPISDNQGLSTIGKSLNRTTSYFTMINGYWHISAKPGHVGEFISVSRWCAPPQSSVAAGWTIVKNSDGTISLKQHDYMGDENTNPNKNYLGGGFVSGVTTEKIYTDADRENAVKIQLVELTDLEVAKERALVVLSKIGVGYPAEGSSARATLQAAIDAPEATAETINTAITAYKEVNDVVLPEAGKVYRIISANPNFYNNQKVRKAVYSDNGEMGWRTLDNTVLNQLWTVENINISSSTMTFFNVADAYYPQANTPVRMHAVKNESKFSFVGDGQFNVMTNKSGCIHANWHDSGRGNEGNIVLWGSGKDNPSSWYIEEVAVTKEILATQINAIKAAYVGSVLIKHEGIASLQAAIEEAQQIHDTDGNYAEAFADLVAAVKDATIEYIDLGYFYMKSRGAQKYAFNDNNDLKVANEKTLKSIFKLIKANNGTFYIQTGNGYYAQNTGDGNSAVVKLASARIEYTIYQMSSGHYVLRQAGATGKKQYWHDANNGTGSIVGWATEANNTQWEFEELTNEELGKIYTANVYTLSAEQYVSYTPDYNAYKEVKQDGGFYVFDTAPLETDFELIGVGPEDQFKFKVDAEKKVISLITGIKNNNYYIIRSVEGNSYARYHSGSELSKDDKTNMLTYQSDLLMESLFIIEEGGGDYSGFYTIRPVADPTLYAYNLGTTDNDSKVAMKAAPVEGALTGEYYWKITYRDEHGNPANITPYHEGGNTGDAYGWNRRGSYSGYNHIGYWQSHNSSMANKWYVCSVSDELLPNYTEDDSVVDYATIESVGPYIDLVDLLSQSALYALKNATFDRVMPKTKAFYRLRNEVSQRYMGVDANEDAVKVYDSPSLSASLFYLDESYALLSFERGRYLDVKNKNLAPIETKYEGEVKDHANDNVPMVKKFDGAIMYKNNGSWTYGNQDDKEQLDKGDSEPGVNARGYYWSFEEVTSLPFTFNAAALGFATFCAPVNVEIPNDVTAYVAEIQGNTLKMRKFVVENGENLILPAETPVMLYKADYLTKATIELPIVDGEYTLSTEDEKKNNFHGTIASETYPAGYTVYSLQKNASDDSKVGFYQKDRNTTLGGFKAWIEIAGEKSARTFTIIFDGDDATGLKEAFGLENENVEIYDLSGRRLDKPTKGINIVGGKLVIK